MQTYTHLGVVLVVLPLCPNAATQGILVGSTLIPDLPYIYEYGRDKLQKRLPFSKMSKGFLTTCEIFNSLIVWLPIIFSVLIWLPAFFWPVLVGSYSHLLLDVISHRHWPETYPSWLWPLPWRIKGWFEYRTEIGKLLTPLDLIVTASCVMLYLCLWVL